MEKENKLFAGVFGWMFIGLLLTFVTGYYLSYNVNALVNILSGGSYFILVIVQLGLVIALSAGLNKFSPMVAKFLFIVYSVVTGITFGSIFVVYDLSSIIMIFLATSIVFGIFALIGNYTNMNLNKMGTYLFMALLAVIICSIINIFLGNTMFDIIISTITVIIFMGFVAYDVQKIRRTLEYNNNENLAIYGALELYLDFINIFIELIRIFGNAKDE